MRVRVSPLVLDFPNQVLNMSEVKFSFDKQVEFEGLKGTLKILIPSAEFKKRVDAKVHEVARKASISGFRPGKVPANLIRTRYLPSILQDEGISIADEAYNRAMADGGYSLAADPEIELQPQPLVIDKDIDLLVKFEIIPEFDLCDLTKVSCEQPVVDYSAEKIKKLVDDALKANPNWSEVDRLTQSDDRITLDFDGFLNEKPFDGGSAKEHQMILGEGKMLEEFEANLIGKKALESFEFPLTFPEDYAAKDLAGKEVVFKVTISKIEAPTLMKLGKPFYKKLGLELATKEEFEKHLIEKDTKAHSAVIEEAFKKKIYEAVSKAVTEFELPGKMLESEAKRLGVDLLTAKDSEVQKVKENVRVSLILQKVIKSEKITCAQEDILAYIKSMSPEYLDVELFLNWYAKDRSRIEQAQFMVLENKVFQYLRSQVQTKEVSMPIDKIEAMLG